MSTLGVIPVVANQGGGSRLALERVLGVPVLLWAAHNLTRALPASDLRVVTADPDVRALASGAGLTILDPEEDFDVQSALIHDPAQFFCAAETVRHALSRGRRELVSLQSSVIERLRAETPEDLELMRAVAMGLDPGHPCVVGIRRMRLGLPGVATRVRAVVTDVDGVLTDGAIEFTGDGQESRRFHMHDGLGAALLRKAGIEIAWLSASRMVGAAAHRAKMLGIEHVDIGEGDKGPRFEKLCADMKVDPQETIYLGDDVNDLPAMRLAGLAACPADARPEVRATCDLVLETPGGRGAFRELADIVLASVEAS